jgi:hypothetical protein
MALSRQSAVDLMSHRLLHALTVEACAGAERHVSRDQRATRGFHIIVAGSLWRVLALAFSACLNAPVEETRFGVFRM